MKYGTLKKSSLFYKNNCLLNMMPNKTKTNKCFLNTATVGKSDNYRDMNLMLLRRKCSFQRNIMEFLSFCFIKLYIEKDNALSL